jgi:hypothetical protein
MLPTVDLNNQSFVTTNEIADVALDGLLPNEFAAINLPVANAIPKHGFRNRLIDAQPPCDPDRFVI